MFLNTADTQKIFKALDGKSRFVGGCVRDMLLGIKADDIDIASPYAPEIAVQKLSEAGIKTIPTGIKHGTITAVVDKRNYEITTLRSDIECYGRHAKVSFTDSWEEDAKRRDFTINAMSCDIDGKIYDYFNGQDDLKNGVVKFVGKAEERCREDVLRILRFFRFYAYYGQEEADINALNACELYAPQIDNLSAERIQKEIIKLLNAPNPLQALSLMKKHGIDKYIFPEHVNIGHLENMLEVEEQAHLINTFHAKLAVMFEIDVSKKISKKWKLSNADSKHLQQLFIVSELLKADITEKNIKQKIRNFSSNIAKEACFILYAKGKIQRDNLNDIIEMSDNWQAPTFPISGKDLKNLNIKPGPQMGKLLKKGEIWWEEKNYKPTKREIIEFISNNLS